MKINALENLIINQLGNKNNQQSQNVPVKPVYPTPAVSGNTALANQQHEVHDIVKIPSERYAIRNNAVPVGNNKSVVKAEEKKAAAVGFSNSNNMIKKIMDTLIEGSDYGRIQGIPTSILFKAGAIKIVKGFELRVQETLLDKTVDIEHSYIGYTIKVSLVDKNGVVVTESIASANSLEKKFVKNGINADSMLPSIAAKRALISAAKYMIGK